MPHFPQVGNGVDKIDVKTKAVVRDEEGHCIMIKGAIQREDITLINIYAAKIGGPKENIDGHKGRN